MNTLLFRFFIITVLLSGCDGHDQQKAKVTPAVPLKKQESSISYPVGPVKPDQPKKKKRTIIAELPVEPIVIIRDTTVPPIDFIEYLRIHEIEIDMNEPLNRSALMSGVVNGEFPTMITLSRERYLLFEFDNDILNYTDRYYTNGIRIELVSPSFRSWPVNRLTFPYWNGGVNYYGIALAQDMFTPSTTKDDTIQSDDRPYAATLYLESFKVTNDPERKLRIRNSIQLGVIGPASLGEFIQTWTHQELPGNNPPVGWEEQIQNDILLNNILCVEKGLLSSKYADVNLFASGSLGTVYTNINGGTFLRIGFFNPYFVQNGYSTNSVNKAKGLRKNQAYAFLNLSGRFVGYDATLQGGLFNHSSVYTLSGGDIQRAQFRGSGGIAVSFGGFSIRAEQFLISPEFKGGLWHKWISIGIGGSF